MTRRLMTSNLVTILAIAMAPFAIAQTKPAAQPDPAVVQEILKLQDAFVEASSKKDVKFFETHVADDYVWISRFGKAMDKQELIGRIEQGSGLLSQVPGSTAKQEEVRVRVYGDTAIHNGLVNRAMGAGQIRTRFTEVFVRTGGTWRLVSTQITHVAPAQ